MTGSSPRAPLRTKEQLQQIGLVIDQFRRDETMRAKADDDRGADELLAIAKSIYDLRRLRDDAFDAGLFSDPAWDILLSLFIAGEEGREVNVTGVCIASAASPTTALRHISKLVSAKLVTRVRSEGVGQPVRVALSPIGREQIVGILRGWGHRSSGT